MAQNTERLMTTDELSTLLGLSYESIKNLLRYTDLPRIQPSGKGGTAYFRQSSIKRWLDEKEKESTSERKNKKSGGL